MNCFWEILLHLLELFRKARFLFMHKMEGFLSLVHKERYQISTNQPFLYDPSYL